MTEHSDALELEPHVFELEPHVFEKVHVGHRGAQAAVIPGRALVSAIGLQV